MSKQTTTPSRSSRSGNAKRPSRGARFVRRFMLFVLVLLVGIAGYLGFLYKKSKDALVLATADAEPGIVVPADQSVKVKPVGILLMGIDTRKETGSLNTDVMMVAVLNPRTKTAAVVSIPRDTRIELDGYRSRKANAYFAKFRAQGIDQGMNAKEADKYAKQEVREMLGKYFGIELSYTATINFQGFVDVVDALGGVPVDVDMDMHYIDNADGTEIDLQKGRQTLDGDQALDYVRYRESNDGTNMSSDFDRNRRQSEVLGAIADKLKSFSGAAKLGNVITAVGSNMRMDIPASVVENLMKTYFQMGRSDIQFAALEGSWRSPYVYVNDESLQKAKQLLQVKLAE